MAHHVCVLLSLVLFVGVLIGASGFSLSAGRSPASAGLQSSIRKGARNMEMMPIGIPKVAYRMPGTRGGGEWLDIFQRLGRERIIFLAREIDDEIANQIIGMLLYLDNENPTQPIYLYINCPGGSVISGLAIYDTIQHIRSEVVTVNLGLSASMASFLLCAGSRGRRFALPHSRVMIHQPMGSAQGQAEDIRVEASQILRIRNSIVKMYSLMTGQTVEHIAANLDRDNYMSAQEALQFGLIDHIISPNDEKLRNLAMSPPNPTWELFGAQPPPDNYQFGKIQIPKERRPSSNSYRRR